MATSAPAAQSYKKIPAGWKVLDSGKGDVMPSGGMETVLLLGKKCRGFRKCSEYEVVITRGLARRKVSEITSSIEEPVSASVNDGSVWISGYQTGVGFYEVWTFQGDEFVVVNGGGTS